MYKCMRPTTSEFSVHFIPWDEEPCTEIIRDAEADWSDSLECTPFGQRCELIYNLSSIPEKNSDSGTAYRFRGLFFFQTRELHKSSLPGSLDRRIFHTKAKITLCAITSSRFSFFCAFSHANAR